MSDEPSPGYSESPTPSAGSTGSIARLADVVVGAGVVGAGVSGAGVDGAVVVVDGDVDVVVGGSAARAYPPGDPPDEHAATIPTPTSRIADTRTDPARRTARTVPLDVPNEAARPP